MRTLTIPLPETVDFNEADLRLIVAARLYQQGQLSLGRAAEWVGLDKHEFIDMLGDLGFPVFNYPAADLEADMNNA